MSGVVGLAVLARVKCAQLEHKVIRMVEAPGFTYLRKTVVIYFNMTAFI
jgi:hypothetical protein